jgi:hypothetical protein
MSFDFPKPQTNKAHVFGKPVPSYISFAKSKAPEEKPVQSPKKPFFMSFTTPKPKEKQDSMKPFYTSFGPPKPAVQQD